MKKDLLYKDEVFKIIGAAMNVHKELGPGFLEAVYQEALEVEFTLQNIPYNSQPQIRVFYRGKPLKKYYEPDYICYEKIIVEIKAMKLLGNLEESQIFNSTKCCKKDLGLLINFGEPSLNWKRFITKKLSE